MRVTVVSPEWLKQKRKCGPDSLIIVDLQPHRCCTLSELLEARRTENAPTLVDTRSHPEFEVREYSYQPRRGHLPSAVLIPFSDLFQPSGRYLDRTAYQERIFHVVQQAPQLVAYCEVGVRASSFALLHEAYTGQVVPVCDGSIMEWALNPELPVQAHV